MEQKIPNISDTDIKRIIERDFSQFEFTKVNSILGRYISESDKGRNRIYVSILKLSAGDIKLLEEYVNKANNDYRDIIALSEYPNYSEHAFDDDLSDKEKSKLISEDWIQYQNWLNRP